MEHFGHRLKDVEIIVTAVLDGSRDSMINVQQCRSLANVCTGIENHLKGWMMQMACRVDAENYVRLLPLLDEVVRVLERGKILVLQYGSAQWFELAVTRGDNQEAFREIHLLLETNMQVLYNHINELYCGIHQRTLLRDSKVTEILIAKESMRANAEHDHDKILETLQMFHENLPTAIAKLKGTPDMYNLPVNMRIDAREVKCGEKIGKGAYGLVRKAYWLGCNFAAKIIRTRNIDALRKEVGILARLSHPHIVQLVGFSTDCATSMILMELMDSDLRHLIKYRDNWTPQMPPFPPEVPIDIISLNSTPQTPPFPPEVAIDIISQIAAGMAYLHKQGIFHGDLKASNVLVNHRGDHIEAKIADFGVSQTVQLTKCFDASKNGDGDMASGSSIYSNSSFSGIVGTTGWRAPEVSHIQTKEGETSSVKPTYTAKADVFSFAMTCYEVLSGNFPYSNDLPRQSINELVREGVRPELPEHINARLCSLIQKCWQTEASERPTFEEICFNLQEIKAWEVTYITITNPPLYSSSEENADSPPLYSSMEENSDSTPLYSPRAGISNGPPCYNDRSW